MEFEAGKNAVYNTIDILGGGGGRSRREATCPFHGASGVEGRGFLQCLYGWNYVPYLVILAEFSFEAPTFLSSSYAHCPHSSGSSRVKFPSKSMKGFGFISRTVPPMTSITCMT